jgi:hypothetical protein
MFQRGRAAFTFVELLVMIAIIGSHVMSGGGVRSRRLLTAHQCDKGALITYTPGPKMCESLFGSSTGMLVDLDAARCSCRNAMAGWGPFGRRGVRL